MQIKDSLSTKEIIKCTLLNLLKEKDYCDIQMKEIAETANVGRRTLYRYFQTKDDIVRFIADSLMDEFAEALLENHAAGLLQISEIYFSFWEKNIDIFHCLDNNHLLHYIEDDLARYIMQVALKTKYKDENMDLDQMLVLVSEEQKSSFNFIIAGYWELTKRWMREENRRTPEEISRLVFKIMTQR